MTSVTGTDSTFQTETLTFPVRGDLSPPQFATANFVGSIDNLLTTDSTTFHFTPLVAGAAFQFGDAPVDGLIAAVTLTGHKNFVPEAFVTEGTGGSAVLVDPLNT